MPNYFKILLVITAIILVETASFSQNHSPGLLLENLKNKYLLINDYQADIEIKVDVSFINIPVKNARIYYKYPDKYKFDAKGFFMLPKRGLNFSVNELLNYNYTAIHVKDELVDNSLTQVFKIIPLDNEIDIVLMTLWIDTTKLLIRKIETNTKNAGSFVMRLKYNKQNLGLPNQVKVSFNVVPLEIPMSFTGELQKEVKSLDPNKKTKGHVTISYSNYKINTGLSDEFFEKKLKKRDSVQ